MDTARLEHFRRRLLEEKKRYAEQVERLNDAGLGQSMVEAYEEMSLYDNHPADAGTEMFEREKDLGLRQNAQRMLMAIDHALARMGRGRYGICEFCGRPIPEERLEAFPMTTLCADCKSAREARPDPLRRPIEEEVLSPPFGRSWRNDKEYAAYDGEDAWQDVAAYGTSETPQDVPGATDYDDLYRSQEHPGTVAPVERMVDEDWEPVHGDPAGRDIGQEVGGWGPEGERYMGDVDNPLEGGGRVRGP
ncbi:TraR/DksA C4-type zinc finger protein [Caldinitratiruptor microaerophilus]|uniref:TraR/DksA C4-type zinc finger protein n=1 Tax=Caldinitratiruptor microaerophilus TaxID=671077 RepID=UPI0022306CA2|nr:TraR/DksA C4-type zinc finger protein [Caldinitratiruptor microaerophilus]